MTDLVIHERGTLSIDESTFEAIRKSTALGLLRERGILTVSLGRRSVELTAGAFVGAMQLMDDLRVVIKEKSTGSLQSLLSLAYRGEYQTLAAAAPYSKASDDYALWLQESAWVAFVAAVQDYLQGGIDRHYISPVRFSSRPRGKLLIKRSFQAAIARGKTGRLYSSAPEISRNTAFNRLLLGALIVVAQSRQPSQRSREAAERAAYASYHFAGVPIDRGLIAAAANGRIDPADIAPPHRFELACLALSVLHHITLLSDGDAGVELPFATFVRMERLFELAVFNAISSACLTFPAHSAHRYEVPGMNVHLFVDTLYKTPRPDVIVCRDGHPVVLADAKYTELTDTDPVDEIYQLLAHCRAFGVSEGWLVGLTDHHESHSRVLGTTGDGVTVRVIALRPAEIGQHLFRAVRATVDSLEFGNAAAS